MALGVAGPPPKGRHGGLRQPQTGRSGVGLLESERHVGVHAGAEVLDGPGVVEGSARVRCGESG
jgi:hypothetical protein